MATNITFSTESVPIEDVAIDRGLRLFLVEVTGALCVILNSLNIAVLRKVPHCFGESTTLLFITLAVIDLTTGVIIMISEAFYILSELPDTWPLFCVLVYPCVVLFGILSAMLLACLSFDKLIAITHPLRYSQLVTKRRVKAVVIGVVLISGMNAVGFWALILRDSTDIMYFHPQSLYCRMHLDGIDGESGSRSEAITLLQTFGFICMFLPLIIVTYVNLRLLVIVYQHSQRQSICPYGKGGPRKSVTTSTIVNGCSPAATPAQSPGPARRDSIPVSSPGPPNQTERGPAEHNGNVKRSSSHRVSLPLINLKIIRRHRESTVSTGTRHRRSHYKGLRTVLVMVIAYYLAWMPMLVDVIINIVMNSATTATYEFVTFFMAYSNSWWNALVYLLMNGTYRAAAHRIIRCDR